MHEHVHERVHLHYERGISIECKTGSSRGLVNAG